MSNHGEGMNFFSFDSSSSFNPSRILPAAETMAGQSFSHWKALRFPSISGTWQTTGEDFLVGLHALWRKETCPPAAIEPDDELLYLACVENYERLVAAILQGRRLEVASSRVGEITQTALGVSMENQGVFGAGPGFMSGCHRRYREDDYAEAEDSETWVPRANRIEKMLREAGAVDYSPLIKACGKGDVDEVRRFLDAGYPPNFAVYGCSTPLPVEPCPSHFVRRGFEGA